MIKIRPQLPSLSLRELFLQISNLKTRPFTIERDRHQKVCYLIDSSVSLNAASSDRGSEKSISAFSNISISKSASLAFLQRFASLTNTQRSGSSAIASRSPSSKSSLHKSLSSSQILFDVRRKQLKAYTRPANITSY